MKKKLIWAGVACLVFAAVAFGWFSANNRLVTAIVVNIVDKQAYEFVSEKEVEETITKSGLCQIGSSRLDELDLRAIEEKVKSYNFVSECHAAKDLTGNLVVDIKQNRPLARIFRPNMKSEYLAANGTLMPLSKKYTARVPVLTGEGTYKIKGNYCIEDSLGKQLFDFLIFVESAEFWKAQITQIELDKKNQIAFYTAAGNQRVEIGRADHVEEKLAKLMTFYKEIVPVKGWGKYQRVNIAYNRQIICE